MVGRLFRWAVKGDNISLRLILGVILGLCLMSQPSWATTAYVTDSFKVTLRTGPSTENKILAMLSSGQAVEVLESDGEWSHVRISGSAEGGREGWVLTRYLLSRQPWEVQFRGLKEENSWLKEKLTQTEKDLTETSRREKEFKTKLLGQAEALHGLQKDYDSLRRGATNYLKLKANYEATQSSLQRAQKNVKQLTGQNEELKSSQRNRWFATGALVLLCGLMIGLVVGRQQRRRKSLYY